MINKIINNESWCQNMSDWWGLVWAQLFHSLKDFDIPSNVQTIVNDWTFNLIKAKKRLDANPPYLRDTLQKILLNINYIDKDTFFNYLEQSIALCKKSIWEHPFIGIGQEYSIPRSEWWIRNLCLQHWLPNHMFFNIATPHLQDSFWDIEKFKDSYLQLISTIKNQHIQDIVIFDDASYSWQQLGQLIFCIVQILKSYNITWIAIHVLCPFMTQQSKNEIKKYLLERNEVPEDSYKILYHNSFVMPVLHDLLSEDSVDRLWAYRSDSWRGNPWEKAYTYFWHKLADKMSFPRAIADGIVPHGKKIPFMTYPVPPYKTKKNN